MRRAFRWFWETGMLSTFLTGLFAVLPIVITVGIMAWVGGLLKAWLGPESFVGTALLQMGLRFVTNPTVASVFGWVAVLLAIWLLGALLKSLGKKRIEETFHATVERIPLVNVLYRPVAQVVDMLQRDPADKLQGMSVVYCAFGRDGGAGFLGLLVSDRLYRFNGQMRQIDGLMHVELSHQPRLVIVDRAGGQSYPAGTLLYAEPLGQEHQDLGFPARQPGQRRQVVR